MAYGLISAKSCEREGTGTAAMSRGSRLPKLLGCDEAAEAGKWGLGGAAPDADLLLADALGDSSTDTDCEIPR